MGTAAASAGAAGPSEGLRAGRSSCRTKLERGVYSGLVRQLLRVRPARSPSEGPAAPADAAAVLMLQQLPAACSHH